MKRLLIQLRYLRLRHRLARRRITIEITGSPEDLRRNLHRLAP